MHQSVEHGMSMDLSPPPQRRPDRSSFDPRRRAVERWLAELPSAHAGASGERLLTALRQVNGLSLRPSLRLRFLETMRGPVEDVADILRRQRQLAQRSAAGRSGLPPADLLLHELALGYRMVVDGLSARRLRRTRQLALALQRTLHLLSRMLVESASRYEPAPAGLWQTLHGLYSLAERQGIAQRAVPDQRLQYGKSSSAAAAYARALLFAAAGPHRMHHNEADDLYTALELWAPYACLLPVRTGSSQSDALYVDLHADRPPFYKSLAVAGSGDLRLVDTRAVIDKAAQAGAARPSRPPGRSPGQPPRPELARRLIAALDPPPPRQSARLPVRANAQILIGLAKIHRHLAAEQGLPTAELEMAAPQFAARELRSGPQADDVWGLIYRPSNPLPELDQPATLPGLDQPATVDEGIQREPAAPEQHWRLLNMSTGGYCLASPRTQTARAQIGRLVALRETGDDHHQWQLAVVRWMTQSASELQIGVQGLGARPVAVLSRNEEADAAPDRCLLLPANTASGQPATLLTVPLRYAVRSRLLLTQQRGESRIVLSRLVESCSGFARFEFQVVQQSASASRQTASHI